jgi:hypothetical protein
MPYEINSKELLPILKGSLAAMATLEMKITIKSYLASEDNRTKEETVNGPKKTILKFTQYHPAQSHRHHQ